MKAQLLSPDTKLSLSEKIRFAIGNTSFPFAFILFSGMVMYYFTDILGISAAAAGTLLLVARVWDGINDPMMGVIVDHTNTRFGKARPYIFVGGLLVAVFTVLLFTNPGFTDERAKLAWAYFTYIGFGMSFTVFMVPLKVFQARLTKERDQIVSLNSFSMFGTSTAAILAALFLVRLINYFAGESGDMDKGYSGCSMVAAVILVIGTLVLSSLKERDFALDHGTEKKKSYPLREAVREILWNKPFIGFCLSSAVVYLGYYISESTVMYYCIYNLGSMDYYTPLSVISYGAPLLSAVTLPYIVKKYGKKKVVVFAYCLIILFFLLRFVTADRNLLFMVIFATIAALGEGYWNTLFTPMALDCALLSEARTGRNMDALFTSSFSLINKLASGVAGSLLGYVLASVGYVENAARQTELVNMSLRILCTASVSIVTAVGLVIYLTLYRVKESELEAINTKIQKEQ